MSILQDYEKQANYLGQETIEAISTYIGFLEKNGKNLLYSDIIYKKKEWQKFVNWHETIYNKKHEKSSEGD